MPRVKAVFPEFRTRFLSGTFLVRRSLFEGSGGYAEDLKYGENNELGWRLLEQVRLQGLHVHSIDRSLVISERRSYPSELEIAEQKTIVARFLLDHHADLLRLVPRKMAKHLRTVGIAALRDGRTKEGRRLLREAKRVERQMKRARPRSVAAYVRRAAARASRLKH
jgi:hypothetical protein